MTKTDVFLAFGNVNDEYLAAAIESMKPAPVSLPRRRLRYAILAASFILIATLIPIIVIIAQNTAQPQLPADSYLSITDIPGAILFSETNNFDPTDIGNYSPHPSQSLTAQEHYERQILWTQKMLRNHTVVVGKASKIESVVIPDGDAYYHLVTLTINIEQNCTSPENTDSVRAVYAVRYKKSAGYTFTEYIVDTPYREAEYEFYYDMGAFLNEEKNSFFLLDPITEKTIEANGKTIDLSKYGDCYMTLNATLTGAISLTARYGVLAYLDTVNEELFKFNGTTILASSQARQHESNQNNANPMTTTEIANPPATPQTS